MLSFTNNYLKIVELFGIPYNKTKYLTLVANPLFLKMFSLGIKYFFSFCISYPAIGLRQIDFCSRFI